MSTVSFEKELPTKHYTIFNLLVFCSCFKTDCLPPVEIKTSQVLLVFTIIPIALQSTPTSAAMNCCV